MINNLHLSKIIYFRQVLTYYMYAAHSFLQGKNILNKMSFLSHYMGEVEYEPETEEWVSLTSLFTNEQTYLPLLRLLI